MATAHEVQNAVKGLVFDFLGFEQRGARYFATARLLNTGAALALSGAATIDGVVANNNDIIVETTQTDQTLNGPWKVQAGAWIRPPGMTCLDGMIFVVSAGTNNSGNWVLRGPKPTITLGVSRLQVSAAPATVITTLSGDRSKHSRQIGVDTSGGPLVLLMPGDFQYEGLTFWFHDMNTQGSFAANNLTINGNGITINAMATLVLTGFKSAILRFNGGSYNVWGV